MPDPEHVRVLQQLISQGADCTAILELVLNSVGDGIAIVAAADETVYLNAAAMTTLGVTDPKGSISLRTHGADLYYLSEFTPLREQDLPLARALRGEEVTDVELFARNLALPDGALIRMNARPLRQADGRVVGGIAIFHDIGARKRAEEELRAANVKLAAWVTELERRASVSLLMNDMADLLQSCLTLDEFYAVVQRYAGSIFENQPGCVLLANPSRTVLDRVVSWGDHDNSERLFQPDSCWALRRGRLHRAGGDRLGPHCSHVSGRGGEYLCIPMMGQGEALGVLHVRQPEGPPQVLHVELQAMVVESRLRTTIAVTEHIALAFANLRLRETLRIQAIRDPLTGLFNRRYMEESLERELARAERSGGQAAAIMIDIDHFKLFNDNFGHAAADLALRETCALISRMGHPEDIVCRYGGEELLVVLPVSSVEEATERAELLRSAVAQQQVQYHGKALGQITASFGVAAFPLHGRTSEELLRAADEALYRAKGAGRNCVRAKGLGSVGPWRRGVAPPRKIESLAPQAGQNVKS